MACRHTLEEQVAPAVPAFGQFWEQQSESVLHCSPGYPQTPPEVEQCPDELQAAEQHCESEVHESPGTPQPVVVGSAHFRLVQVPVQHCGPLVQSVRSGRQWSSMQAPPSHLPVQQSVGSVQASPTRLQPPGPGSTHSMLLQAPEQQSEGVAHGAVNALHWASTQIWFWQLPEQHSPGAPQASPSCPSVHWGWAGDSSGLEQARASAPASRTAEMNGESLGVRMEFLPRVGRDSERAVGSFPRFHAVFHVVAGG